MYCSGCGARGAALPLLAAEEEAESLGKVGFFLMIIINIIMSITISSSSSSSSSI